ncbi:MAG TPA: glycosyltransferase family 9 protein [Albitalea sp.]|nr:glycosyltransferase family 9 protein [Albitalea sp.]
MDSFDRILVVIPAQLGDVLICTPLIRAARERWPAASIDVLGFAGTLELLAGNADVSRCIEIARAGGVRWQLRQALQLWRRYDLAFVARTSDRAHLYGLVAARRRSAFVPGSGPGSRWKRWITHHRVVPRDGAHHVLERLRLIEPWVPMPAALSLVPPTPAALPPAIEAQLAHPFVVVQVPSMWRYKQWPLEHFRRVVQGLLDDGVQVVLTGSGSAHDQSQVAGVRDVGSAPALLDASGQLSLSQVAALLARADAYLGPDTSVTHLAAAVGTPIVSVYGPSLPDAFGPWPQGHAAVVPWQRRAARQEVRGIVLLQGEDLPGQRCVPCNRMGCENRHDSQSHCLATLSPERVLGELRAMLQAPARVARQAGERS